MATGELGRLLSTKDDGYLLKYCWRRQFGLCFIVVNIEKICLPLRIVLLLW